MGQNPKDSADGLDSLQTEDMSRLSSAIDIPGRINKKAVRNQKISLK